MARPCEPFGSHAGGSASRSGEVPARTRTYDDHMLEIRPVPVAEARPPWWRSLLLALGGGFMAVLSAVFSPVGYTVQTGDGDGGVLFHSLLSLFVVIGWMVAVFWRHRAPLALTLASAGAALLVPIGPVPALVSLASLVGRRQGPGVWVTAGGVAAVSAWLTAWDLNAQPRGASMLKTILGPQAAGLSVRTDLEISTGIGVFVLGIALAIGGGVLMRSRREAAFARQEVVAERRVGDVLGDELARREERERIAREVHDAMGHRLSLLNLHAGALEMRAEGDEKLAESAHVVSESARAAHADLRSLLSALREPLGSEPPAISLVKLQEVVGDSIGAGESINSSIFIESAESADPALSRAVYRIVQELLTNARKHAPGQQIRLDVAGGPSRGVMIETVNRLAGPLPPPSRDSRGLAGIAERAEGLGGTIRYGLDQNGTVFRVTVELPWS